MKLIIGIVGLIGVAMSIFFIIKNPEYCNPLTTSLMVTLFMCGMEGFFRTCDTTTTTKTTITINKI